MYLEHDRYFAYGEVYEMVLVQKNKIEVGFMWILGLGSFRVVGIFESQMQALTVILTNEFGTSIVQIISIATVKLEVIDDNVVVLLDFEDDICAFVDLSNTLSFSFKSVPFIPSQLPTCVAKCPCSPMYGRLVSHISPSQRPPLHPSPSSIGFTIFDALKLRKSKKKSKSDLISIDFDNTDVHMSSTYHLLIMTKFFFSCPI
jgi:hypothetical protein